MTGARHCGGLFTFAQEAALSPHRTPSPDGFYDSAEVAELLSERIGRRITPRAVRDEWRNSAAGRGTDARSRPTFGLPEPHREGKALLYPRAAVHAWLKQHPGDSSSQLERLVEQLVQDKATGGGNRLSIVRDAKALDYSWAFITNAINQADGKDVSRQAVAKRYSPHL